ncbi:hypothetical protein N781_02600 [Pontibacillus halophilus JSM 076056 = DSM 19796]|uniref:MobA-like NTP transferase domain-containing protein n=2 Tax=Pontibacillus TaxID=289201 RepID=A0A0A5GLH2_9BACI|nr:hypothetical protein N781_02600 [Pontibacillus halophilus JSM 076056 = DSM 19796]
MGQNKALIQLGSSTVAERILSTLQTFTSSQWVVANDRSSFLPFNGRVIRDEFVGEGPLAGLESAIRHSEAPWIAVVACDMPYTHHSVWEFLSQHIGSSQAVVPIYEGRIQPLSALYHKSIHSTIVQLLEDGERSLRSLLQEIHVLYVEEWPSEWIEVCKLHFFNMNDPEDLNVARHLLSLEG